MQTVNEAPIADGGIATVGRMNPKAATKYPAPTVSAAVPPKKKFSVQDWSGAGEGEKILVYARSGSGKTTLAASAPDPVFIGIDDGGRKIVNPITKKPVRAVVGEGQDGSPALFTFEDVQNILRTPEYFPAKSTIVIDTLSGLQFLAERYLAQKKNKPSFKEIGWDGLPLLGDLIRGVLADLDKHIRRGVNVILICQEDDVITSNPDGSDYREAVPLLAENKMIHLRSEVIAWSDHVFRIGFEGRQVTGVTEDKSFGKASGTLERTIFTVLSPTFYAKSRHRFPDGSPLPDRIPFDTPATTDVWDYLFKGSVPGK